MYVFSDMLGECTLHMMFSHASCVHTHVTPLNKRSPCQPMHSPPPLRPLGPRRSELQPLLAPVPGVLNPPIARRSVPGAVQSAKRSLQPALYQGDESAASS